MIHFHRYKWGEPEVREYRQCLNPRMVRYSVPGSINIEPIYRDFTREVQYGKCSCGKIKKRYLD